MKISLIRFLIVSKVILGCSSVEKRPNIIWLVCEDQSQSFFPMYGDNSVELPNLKELAEDSVIYENMHATTPVCSPARSAIITGMYPTSIGTHNMRAFNEGRPTNQPQLNIPSYSPSFPTYIKPFTMYLRQDGYYCTNSNKEDYNFKISEDAWDQSCNYCQGAEKEDIHWRNRSQNQAFFSVFNFQITHEAQIWEQAGNDLFISGDEVIVPPYFPNHETVRKDMAINYSNLIRMDQQLGQRIKELKDEGLYDDAYIFFYSDHGGPFPRHKRAIYDTGVKVPFMIKYPKSRGAGSRVDALLSFIDLAPTVLDIAGIEIPKYLQGLSILNSPEIEREYLVTASDRFDEEVDRIRSVKTKKFKLIKNYYPNKSHALPVAYRENMPMMKLFNEFNSMGKLNYNQKKWFLTPKSTFELYDLTNDPYELNNLSDKDEFKKIVKKMDSILNNWIVQTKDLGEYPESFIINNSLVH